MSAPDEGYGASPAEPSPDEAFESNTRDGSSRDVGSTPLGDAEDQYYDVQDEDDEDALDEDDLDLIANIGEDPLMAPVQEALHRQLKSVDERLSLELHDALEDDRRTKTEREDVGVRLYGIQQQLAKLQLQVEDVHNESAAASNERSAAESEIKVVSVDLQDYQTDITQEKGKLEANKTELNALIQTLRQVEEYNDSMKDEIAVVRRATYKAEESVQQMEKRKQDQDMLVDSLNEEAKQLHEQIALYQAQIESQSEETAAATKTLKEASKEMATIEFEKKQLIQQWQSSLVGLQRRDEALQATHDAIQEERESHVVMRGQIDGYKRTSTACQGQNEASLELKMRLEHGLKQVEDQGRGILRDTMKLKDKMKVLRRSLEATDGRVGAIVADEKSIAKQVRDISNKAQVLDRQRIEFEEEISKKQSEQTTSSKAVKNLMRDAQKLQDQLRDMEIEQASKENELARVKVDCLNTKSFTQQLSKTLEGLNEELNEKDHLIGKYQLEIRQRNDEVEKKMYIVDRLNRKYEALTVNQEEENLGPLEATIKNLQKQASTLSRQNRDIEHQWLKAQTELVSVVDKTDATMSIVHELRSREAILQQKQMRLDREINENRKEVDKLNIDVGSMHNDITKLNELLSKNKKVQDELANVNYVMQADFVEQLKQLEEQSVAMDSTIVKAHKAKEISMEEIVEVEEQLMLWTKKIELERETRSALDPEVGQSVVRSMEKEVHRMKIRREALTREREKLLKEMEQAIYKHDAISVRHKGKKEAPGKLTKATLEKRMHEKKRRLNEVNMDVTRYCDSVKSKVKDADELGMTIDKLNSKYKAMEEQANELQSDINTRLFEKQRRINAINKRQRLLQRYSDFDEGNVHPPNGGTLAKQLHTAQEKITSMLHVIELLQEDFPHLVDVLERVANLVET